MTPDSHDIGTPARAAVQPDTRAHTKRAGALIYTVLAMAGWRLGTLTPGGALAGAVSLGFGQCLIAANNPASPYFNGSQVWAPMMRQIGYLGLRYAPSGLEEK